MINPAWMQARSRFVASELPVITNLRDTQVYIQAAAMGETLFDLPRSQSEKELEHWLPLIDWVRARK